MRCAAGADGLTPAGGFANRSGNTHQFPEQPCFPPLHLGGDDGVRNGHSRGIRLPPLVRECHFGPRADHWSFRDGRLREAGRHGPQGTKHRSKAYVRGVL